MEYNVAHYCIGRPYSRVGGLVKYVESLVEIQSNDRNFNSITVIYPGYIEITSQKPYLKIEERRGNIKFAAIINANPETLLEGIENPSMSIENIELENAFVDFIAIHGINIIHFHSFFCLPASLLGRLKRAGVKLLYTSHDYQPLCPTSFLLDSKRQICENNEDGNSCTICNHKALSRNKILIRNNKLSLFLQSFQRLKSLGKMILQRPRKEKDTSSSEVFNFNEHKSELYKRRNIEFKRSFNKSLDCIIYNSAVSEKAYKEMGITAKSCVIPVSHSKMEGRIEPFLFKIESGEKIRFGYLGGNRVEKGGVELIELFKRLKEEGFNNFEFHIFGENSQFINIPRILNGSIVNHGFIDRDVYRFFDVLLVPSIWKETFGFIVFEALANKKPVIASSNVGATKFFTNDLFVYDTLQNLYRILCSLLVDGVCFNFHGFKRNLSMDFHHRSVRRVYMCTLDKTVNTY